MFRSKYSLLVLLALFGFSLGMRLQAVGVKGKLLCGDKPAAGVQVKIWDEDEGPDPDDELDAKFTNTDGTFEVKGATRELTTIDPVFKVYHDCNDGIMPGQRKIKFRVPSDYITNGGVPAKLFDIGVLNLETVFPGEERDLL